MTDQYEIGRSDEGPRRAARRYARWSPLWEKIVKAFDEGYRGWVTMKLPNHQEAKNAAGALYHRRRYHQRPAEFHYRRQEDGTYVLFARLLETEEASDG